MRDRVIRVATPLAIALTWTVLSPAPVDTQDVGFRSAWPGMPAETRTKVTAFAEDFKGFLGKAKSEMTFVRE
ncbi:MAG: hypothetical protein U0Q12_04195, partial [Vicinamibacterales bacterium]